MARQVHYSTPPQGFSLLSAMINDPYNFGFSGVGLKCVLFKESHNDLPHCVLGLNSFEVRSAHQDVAKGIAPRCITVYWRLTTIRHILVCARIVEVGAHVCCGSIIVMSTGVALNMPFDFFHLRQS